MTMFSHRYGDLCHIARCTDERCHLCHQPAYLEFYGRPGDFGDDTVTVDHLFPQAFGGGDEPENLRLAHARCNSVRGTKDIEVAREALSGTTRAPMSSTGRTLVAASGGVVLGVGAGHLFAKRDTDGTRRFNTAAALGVGLVGTLVLRGVL